MSGSTIGGVAGGVIGFVATGGNPVGARWGFMIGSAIGGYVDPVQVKGPRLSDAMSQTSSIGGVIPFGYGRYVTAGNIIWRDRLIEHVKRQRQGKGASSKTTTYTYTRSYAVGVCQGEIYGFHWIKRNGKKVYTSDPAATAEEKAYSAKWLRKVTLHRGGESQMPDSTIVAVEGAGNVSPFRGLAYIVVENDDLTDLSGAIPQYEFAVIATSVAYVTTQPYVIEHFEDIDIAARSGAVTNVQQPFDLVGFGVSASALSIENRLMRQYRLAQIGGYEVGAAAVSIENRLMRQEQLVQMGSLGISAAAVGIENKQVRIVIEKSQNTQFGVSASSISIEVVIP